jgi:hypothetical protein
MRVRISSAGLISLVVSLVLCPLAQAETQGADSDEWQFTVIPYLWMAGLDGDITVKGVTSSVDVSFGDILDNLDLAAQAHIEAKKGKWAFFLDPTYIKMSADETVTTRLGTTLKADATNEMWLVEGGVFYRLCERPLGNDEARTVAFDALGGVRYNYLRAKFDLKGSGGLLDVDVDKSKDWFDPIVGGRIQARLSEKLLANLRADIGGFDISGASDFTWNVVAVLGYQLKENITLLAGYRALGIDYDDGSGDDLFEYDVTMSGPIVGLAIQF